MAKAKKDKPLRDKLKMIRVSVEELEVIERNTISNGYKRFSSFARDLLLGKLKLKRSEVPVSKDKETVALLIYELNKIGVNINQIAKNSNTNINRKPDKIFEQEEVKRLDDSLKLLTSIIEKLLIIIDK